MVCARFSSKQMFVYMVTNKRNTVIYTGVTNNLKRRIFEHRNGIRPGFTKRYNAHKLVYYEIFADPFLAISREKQIKAGSRRAKEALIRKMNPEWKDLYPLV
jgi:putative endonuclease